MGAILSNEISKIHGADGLPKIHLVSSLMEQQDKVLEVLQLNGLFMKSLGTANDYFGKGLSGATLIAQVPEKATFVPHENVIVGNVCLYGAYQGRGLY